MGKFRRSLGLFALVMLVGLLAFGASNVTQPAATISTGRGQGVVDMVTGANGTTVYALTAFLDNNSLKIVDTTTDKVVKTCPVGSMLDTTNIDVGSKGVFVADHGADKISLLDLSECAEKGYKPTEWDVSAFCDGPYDVKSIGDKVYVTCSLSDNLAILDSSGKLADSIPLGHGPRNEGLFSSWGQRWLLIANYYDWTASLINLSTNEVVKTLNTGPYPYDVITAADKFFGHVLCSVGDKDTIIDTASRKVWRTCGTYANPISGVAGQGDLSGYIFIGAEFGNPASDTYGLEGTIQVATVFGPIVKNFQVGRNPTALALTPDGKLLVGYNEGNIDVYDVAKLLP